MPPSATHIGIIDIDESHPSLANKVCTYHKLLGAKRSLLKVICTAANQCHIPAFEVAIAATAAAAVAAPYTDCQGFGVWSLLIISV